MGVHAARQVNTENEGPMGVGFLLFHLHLTLGCLLALLLSITRLFRLLQQETRIGLCFDFKLQIDLVVGATKLAYPHSVGCRQVLPFDLVGRLVLHPVLGIFLLEVGVLLGSVDLALAGQDGFAL